MSAVLRAAGDFAAAEDSTDPQADSVMVEASAKLTQKIRRVIERRLLWLEKKN
ncbi:MAG: hypothetical protein SGI99_03295 [Pseudomonadota bacterium]|nr:hypothetical protein [Pseudomonadota bacterium]